MRLLAALATLPLLVPVGAALARDPETQMVCVARADGLRGEAVTVFIHVQPDGSRVAAYASWAPPLAFQDGIGGPDQPDLDLLIGFDAISARGLGQPNPAAQVLLIAFSPPRDRVPAAKLQGRLAVLHGEVRYAAATPTRFDFNQPGPAHQDLPGTALRTASVAMPAPYPATLELSVRDRKGKLIVSRRYSTGSASTRDPLFAKAYAEADAKAAAPASCEPTTGPDAIYAGAASG